MNILLTNDDGFDFPGIISLQEKLSSLGKITIIAPEKESSGTSQAITLFDPLKVQKMSDSIYSVNGYPSDCVNIGLHSNLLPDTTDLVISGINKGVNMGADIWYSGTVAGARQAFIHGCSGLAVSCGYSEPDESYDQVAEFTLQFIREYILSSKISILFNLNYPTEQPVKGLKWSHLGQRVYEDIYTPTQSNDSGTLYQLQCLELDYIPQEGSDFDVYKSGYVSVTPLCLDATDYKELNKRMVLHEI